MAWANDPAVIQAAGALRNAQAGVTQSRGAFLPDLRGSASGTSSFAEGQSRIDPITGELIDGNTTSKGINFGLSSSLDLFSGFRRLADLRSAALSLQMGGVGYYPSSNFIHLDSGRVRFW